MRVFIQTLAAVAVGVASLTAQFIAGVIAEGRAWFVVVLRR